MLAYLTEKIILDNHILSGLPAAQSWRHPFGEKEKGRTSRLALSRDSPTRYATFSRIWFFGIPSL